MPIQKNKNNVALLLVYLGKFPSYFHLFLNSLHHQAVDLLLFTDQPFVKGTTENVSWHYTDKQIMQTSIREKLGITANIDNPYKLCDFKPCFGLLFDDYLKKYAWWGVIDPDIILGNLDLAKTYLNKPSLLFLSGLPFYVSGALFFVRNCTEANTIFMKGIQWRKALENPDYVCFDECAKLWGPLQSGKPLNSLPASVDSMTHILEREKKHQEGIMYAHLLIEPKGLDTITITPKKVIFLEKEWAALHLLYFKNRWHFHCNLKDIGYPFFINSYGIFKRPASSLLAVYFSKNFRKAQWTRLLMKIGWVGPELYKLDR